MTRETMPAAANAPAERTLTLEAEIERLKNFFEIHKTIGTVSDIDRLLPLVMTEISRFLNADRSTLFLIDWDRRELWTKFAESLEVDRISIKLKMGLVGLTVISRKLLNVPNAYEDPRFNAVIDEGTGYRTECLLAAPFFDSHGEVKGAIQLLNKKTGRFTVEDEKRVLNKTAGLMDADFSQSDRVEYANKIIAELRQATECERGALFLVDHAKGEVYSVVAEGLGDKPIRLNINLGIAGWVAVTGQELNIDDTYSDPRFNRSTDLQTGYRTRCIVCIPIRNSAGEIMGVIQAINKKDGVFSAEDLGQLKALSFLVAIPLENAILFAEQKRQFRSLLKVMAASIDAKDSLTAGHSADVERYATGIARELGFGENEIELLSVAALLHDYGKLGIDDHILKKPGKLNPQEYDAIKQHVVITHAILSEMRFSHKYRNLPLIASSHHERLDGSGYPNGLKGKDIPFLSKILAVADVFEALIAKRHYRDALPSEEAFAILEKDAGTRFDANIIAALKRFLIRAER